MYTVRELTRVVITFIGEGIDFNEVWLHIIVAFEWRDVESLEQQSNEETNSIEAYVLSHKTTVIYNLSPIPNLEK